MVSPQKDKGDRAERELAALLSDELGLNVKRALGAGRQEDVGDIFGIPDVAIQATARTDLARAIREKLPEVEQQRQRAGATYSAVFARRRGGEWVVVMTPAMFCSFVRETL